MDMLDSQNMTILGLFALVIAAAVKEFFGWISKKNIQNSETRFENLNKAIAGIGEKVDKLSEKVETIADETSEMYDWHDKADQDGVKVWYIRQSLENALRDNAKATEAIARNIELQTRLLEELIQNQRNIGRDQAEVMKVLHDIERNIEE